MAFELAKDSVVTIQPAKCFTADAEQRIASKYNYGDFQRKIVPHIKQIVFYPCCKDVFDILQVDGITYFVFDKNKTYEKCIIKNICKHIQEFNGTDIRDIRNRQTLINIGNEIIGYIGKYNRFYFKNNYYTKKYQVWTNTQAPGGNLSTVTSPRKTLFIGESKIEEDLGLNIQRSTAEICSFTSDSENECKSFVSWLNCKFTRFFTAINQSKLTGIITDDCFRFVPVPPVNEDGTYKFDHIYTDKELYNYYGLDRPEAKTSDGKMYIDIIESVVKER